MLGVSCNEARIMLVESEGSNVAIAGDWDGRVLYCDGLRQGFEA